MRRLLSLFLIFIGILELAYAESNANEDNKQNVTESADDLNKKIKLMGCLSLAKARIKHDEVFLFNFNPVYS